jgi:hypothetical protein
VLAIEERGGEKDLRGSGRRSITPYVHGRINVLYCCRPSKSFSRAFCCFQFSLSMLTPAAASTTEVEEDIDGGPPGGAAD